MRGRAFNQKRQGATLNTALGVFLYRKKRDAIADITLILFKEGWDIRYKASQGESASENGRYRSPYEYHTRTC